MSAAEKSEIIRRALASRVGMTPKLAKHLETLPIAEVRAMVGTMEELSPEEQDGRRRINEAFGNTGSSPTTAPGVWNLARIRAAVAEPPTYSSEDIELHRLETAINGILQRYDDPDVVLVAEWAKEHLDQIVKADEAAPEGSLPDAASSAARVEPGVWNVARLRAVKAARTQGQR